MPTYEYACKSCGEHLEVVQSFRDEPLTTCPNCGGDLRKVFGAIGIAFKGSGFYKTDSRTSGAGGKAKSEAKDAKEPAKSGAGSGSSSSATGSDGKKSADTAGSSGAAGSSGTSGTGTGDSKAAASS